MRYYGCFSRSLYTYTSITHSSAAAPAAQLPLQDPESVPTAERHRWRSMDAYMVAQDMMVSIVAAQIAKLQRRRRPFMLGSGGKCGHVGLASD